MRFLSLRFPQTPEVRAAVAGCLYDEAACVRKEGVCRLKLSSQGEDSASTDAASAAELALDAETAKEFLTRSADAAADVRAAVYRRLAK